MWKVDYNLGLVKQNVDYIIGMERLPSSNNQIFYFYG